MTSVSPPLPSATDPERLRREDAFLASMARHGGRAITDKLYRRLTAGVEDTTERGAQMTREALAGEVGESTLHRVWHYSIDPAGTMTTPCAAFAGPKDRYFTGSRKAWTSVAEGFALAGGNPHAARYLTTRRSMVPREAFDWPIYRAAMTGRLAAATGAEAV